MKSLCFILLISLSATSALAQSPYIEAVDEYVPAPGQFVNLLPRYEEGDDAAAMVRKCSDAIAHNAGGLITLGAWGGYVTFHFDHPVLNVPGQKDIFIAGNAIEGNSEAGIVMVSQDVNRNGVPDDPWYELAGSADDGLDMVWHDYQLTYHLDDPLADIPWSDNYGNSGLVPRNSFHNQAYFPLWLQAEDGLHFSGTRLPDNSLDTSGNGSYWTLEAFPYGYADNLPNSNRDANSFDLGQAVDRDTRTPANLTHIDFVRIYTGLNQVAGWLGETSTEIMGAEDLHPEATSHISPTIGQQSSKRIVDLWGRRQQGIYNIIIQQ